MKKLLFLSFAAILFIAPKIFAQSDNGDFNPFPQMEQDLNNTNDQTAQQQTDQQDQPSQDQQNLDQWPPPTTPSNQVQS